mgnify:CR=1 FL=1
MAAPGPHTAAVAQLLNRRGGHYYGVSHPQVETSRQCDGPQPATATRPPRRGHQGPHGRFRRGKRGHRRRAARLQHG